MTQITAAATVALATAPGQRLEPAAAAAWDAAVRAYGSCVLLTDSFRPVSVQEAIFRARYRPGNLAGRPGYTRDVRYWSGQAWTRLAGTAAAAVPGTSNHGSGRAVDVKTRRAAGDPARPAAVIFNGFTDPDRLAFLAIAKPYGWADDEGRTVAEPWHLTYYPDRDTHAQEGYDMHRLDLTNAAAAPVRDMHVDNLQGLLNGTSHYNLKIDGIAGKATADAVEHWQRRRGLTPDRIVGPATWRDLIEY